ncbi:MAG: shikimate dehydrogenase [Ignavibacterium sp.]|nr:shikimate dehydrogenase [Ignavibacterium sp.]MCX7611013.1 shikimate dehydrogenase [Ignavibacterium sp.]MDW8374064.1 shikimate dehydrogenase [Ignavibacteriales bacterium]
MQDFLRLKTNLIGLIGHPIKQTYSPLIHNLAIKIKNLDYYYLPFDVESINLKRAIDGLIALNFIGFNVTIPYKSKVLPLINYLSEEALVIGAINTVTINEGNLSGYNTDVFGVVETLINYKSDLIEKEFTVFGAGGSARAVIYALIKNFKPTKIYLINRTEDRALVIKESFREKLKFNSIEVLNLVLPDLVEIIQSSKLVVNATSVGMYPEVDDSVINSEKFFNKDQIIFDLIYNPQETKFLEYAKRSGATTINGLDMLIYQAAKSFELWTSEEFPISEVKQELGKILRDSYY